MRPRSNFVLVLVTCAILAGCDRCSKDKGADKTDPAAVDAAAVDAAAVDAAAVDTAATADQAAVGASSSAQDPGATPTAPATELQITDVKAGSGLEAADGKRVTVHYTGTLVDGTKFDSSKDRGTPFPFVLGSGMVIAGWEQGVKGMKEGGVRKLVIPPQLAYGNRGVGSVIPPNSTLVFEIELLKVE